MGVRKKSPLSIPTTETHSCSIALRLSILKGLPFFAGLPPTEFDWINSFFREQDFESGETIYAAGDQADKLYVIASGRVGIFQSSISGKEILLDLLTQGEFFGSLSGYGNEVYSDSAVAKMDSCILVIEKASFQKILLKHPQISISVIEIMASRLRSAQDHISRLSTQPVEGRIAGALLSLASKFGEKKKFGLLLQVPVSRDDLANMTGTTTESASRVMSRFQKEGLIKSGRKWIAILDLGQLSLIAETINPHP